MHCGRPGLPSQEIPDPLSFLEGGPWGSLSRRPKTSPRIVKCVHKLMKPTFKHLLGFRTIVGICCGHLHDIGCCGYLFLTRCGKLVWAADLEHASID